MKWSASARKLCGAKPRPTNDAVIIDLIRASGGEMSFKGIFATIQKRKLVKTKATNFGNVLRRTISTSRKIKRAGRGVYRA